MKKAVVLLSGGLDSTVSLYAAKKTGYEVHALTITYGQRHTIEIEKAKKTASVLGFEHIVMNIDFPWKGSALIDSDIDLPKNRDEENMQDIPITYVPARNTLFLSYALSWAEVLGAEAIFIGANQVDYSGYPDCRSEFLRSIEETFRLGTKQGVEGNPIQIKAPLLDLKKAGIIKLGVELEVPFENTWSCYSGGEHPCGECDSCILRAKGFEEAGVEDTLLK